MAVVSFYKNDIRDMTTCILSSLRLYAYSHKFNCFIDTTAKFSKNCRVRSYDNEEGISISDFLKKNQTHQWHYNWLEVYSVDDDGYITDCMIYSAG